MLFIFILSVVLITTIALVYTILVKETKKRLRNKINDYEKFLDVVKVICLNAKELSFVGNQGHNSLFFELRFTEKHIHKEIYRVKIKDDIIRFDRVMDNAWYKQGKINNFHVNKLASIDLRKYNPENQLFGGIDFGGKIIPTVKKYKNLTEEMEEDLEDFIDKLKQLSNQRKRVSQGYNVNDVIQDNDVLEFVKRDYNERSD